jgi:cytoskeletal protein CcmA (bactofilin family)
MWKRDESVQPSPAGRAASVPTVEIAQTPEPRDAARIGRSVVIKGELTASEDLIIDGSVEGRIELRKNVLTVGPEGRIKADVVAKWAIVEGQVIGNVTATERIDLRDAGSLDGDLSAPRISIADGAHFRGSIDMQRPATR